MTITLLCPPLPYHDAQAKEQITLLSGLTAPTAFLNKLALIAFNHDPRIAMVDTVRAYHTGGSYIVEVHIVLPEDMSLKDAHNIGEPLSQKLEEIDQVARAFVHLDFEGDHHPDTEHKLPQALLDAKKEK
jgi:divalent metal cation (Fe/Co/Zn/Cd) transporter